MSIACGIDNCKKTFGPNHIARHRSTHLGKTIACESCEEKFANKEYLTKHVKRHHLKLFKLCEYCGTEFPNPSLLTKHKAARNKYQFPCDHCCMSFRLKSNLNAHLKTLHQDSIDNSVGQVAENMDGFRNDQNDQPGPSTISIVVRKASGIVTVKKRRLNVEQCDTRSPTLVDDENVEDDDCVFVPQTQSESSVSVQKKTVRFAANVSHDNDNDDENDYMGPTQAQTVISNNDEEDSQQQIFENSPPHAQNLNELSGLGFQGSADLGISPIPAVGENAKVIHTESLLLASDKDLDAFFALQIWGLLKDQSFYNNLQQHEINMDPQIFALIVDHLTERRSFTSNEQLYAFLSKKPQDYTGRFPVAILILDYCFKTLPKNVMDLCMEIASRYTEFNILVEKAAQFILQRSQRVELTEVCNIDEVPMDVLDKIDYNFLSVASSDEKKVATLHENQLLSKLNMHLSDMLFRDNKENAAKLFDPSLEPLERARLWIQVVQIVTNLLSTNPSPSLFETLLLHHLERHQFTTEYFKVKCGNAIMPVHFHDRVVSRIGGKKTDEIETVLATEDDVKTVTKMLYSIYKPDEILPRITTGVFEMATRLQLVNVWQFLFRNESVDDILHRVNRKVFLQVIICLRNDGIAGKVATGFKDYLPENERWTCFNGLSHHDLRFFLQLESLTIDDMERYFIIAHWAFDKEGKTFSGKYDPAAKQHYDLLRDLVKVKNLDLVQVARHGLVLLQDIKLARKAQQ